jgi:hypothetical protein
MSGNNDCCICLEAEIKDCDKVSTFSCNHFICRGCHERLSATDFWNCPLCRKGPITCPVFNNIELLKRARLNVEYIISVFANKHVFGDSYVAFVCGAVSSLVARYAHMQAS